MARKQFQDLHLKDAFLFAAALSDEETCRMLLEVMLGEKVEQVRVHAEHALLFNSDSRSIRLDIYAQDEARRCYNVEMQGEDKGNLPKRSRYHQAETDVTSLKPGEDFSELGPSCVIFLCCFDPFGQGLYRYTFENRCLETDLPLGDGTRKIFFNTRGRNDENISKELRHFLHYVENSTGECAKEDPDGKVGLLHEKITALKKSREWERRYMTLDELIKDAEKASRKEGFAEGQALFGLLLRKMVDAGESDKLAQLADSDFFQEMCKKYQIHSDTF
ncbi:MAG: Rpn family recombination-promoting nuclease/putative transposase [Lachnospiraceae bacterium]|nr:Rpn family recombination-promoting nuclease/putative transposase [Lachnospiraceae bacterium]